MLGTINEAAQYGVSNAHGTTNPECLGLPENGNPKSERSRGNDSSPPKILYFPLVALCQPESGSTHTYPLPLRTTIRRLQFTWDIKRRRHIIRPWISKARRNRRRRRKNGSLCTIRSPVQPASPYRMVLAVGTEPPLPVGTLMHRLIPMPRPLATLWTNAGEQFPRRRAPCQPWPGDQLACRFVAFTWCTLQKLAC